jgi:hypothetical protein
MRGVDGVFGTGKPRNGIERITFERQSPIMKERRRFDRPLTTHLRSSIRPESIYRFWPWNVKMIKTFHRLFHKIRQLLI